MRVIPSNGHMLVHRDAKLSRGFETRGGIVEAGKIQANDWETAMVVDEGPGLTTRDGKVIPPPASKDDWVLLRPQSGDARHLGFMGPGTQYMLITLEDVLAVLDQGADTEYSMSSRHIPGRNENAPDPFLDTEI